MEFRGFCFDIGQEKFPHLVFCGKLDYNFLYMQQCPESFRIYEGEIWMRTTGIVTDSHSSISQSEAEKLGIFVLPMPFYMNGTCYYEGINITREEFLERLGRLEDTAPHSHHQMQLWSCGTRHFPSMRTSFIFR